MKYLTSWVAFCLLPSTIVAALLGAFVAFNMWSSCLIGFGVGAFFSAVYFYVQYRKDIK